MVLTAPGSGPVTKSRSLRSEVQLGGKRLAPPNGRLGGRRLAPEMGGYRFNSQHYPTKECRADVF